MKRHAIGLVLASAAGLAGAQQPADTLNDTQRHGRAVLAQSCGICHLAPSRGAKTYGPPLHRLSASGNDLLMRAFITNGGGRMPAFKYYLKPEEIDALIAYIRSVPEPKGD